MTVRWTDEEYAAFLKKTGGTVPAVQDQALSSALAALGLGKTGKKSKKRRGVEVGPILESVKNATHKMAAGQSPAPWLSLWFNGARLLTVNELFSIQQFRKHDTFRYKKAWRQLVGEALAVSPGPLPYFDGPTRLTLYRRGSKLIDLDSFAAVFKYAIDALRRHGIIDDDNPEVIVEIESMQLSGDPAVAMRLDALPGWTKPTIPDVEKDWFS